MIVFCAIVLLGLRMTMAMECQDGVGYIFTKADFPLGNAKLVIPQQSREECAKYCTTNRDATSRNFECQAFDYSTDSRACMLSGDEVPQISRENRASADLQRLLAEFGTEERDDLASVFSQVLYDDVMENNTVVERTKRQAEDESGHYAKLCLDGDQRDDEQPVTFTRTEGKVLLGATDQVITASSLSNCARACLQSRFTSSFLCRSLMYYSSSGQCLLNSLAAVGERDLVEERDGLDVEYLENHVVSASCPSSTTPTYALQVDVLTIKTFTSIVDDVSRFACENYCTNNRGESGIRLECRSYAYNDDDSECYLQEYGETNQKFVENVKVYEKLCVKASTVCIRSPSLARIRNFSLVGHTSSILHNISTVGDCLSSCFDTPNCLSVNYRVGECYLNTATRLAMSDGGLDDGVMKEIEEFDYYDNLCAVERENGVPNNACTHTGDATYIEHTDTGTVPSGFSSMTKIEDVDLETCLQTCETRTDMTCRSTDFHAKDRSCTLTWLPATELVVKKGVDHYERLCVPRSQLVCGGLGIAFVARRGLKGRGDWETLQVAGLSVEECLGLCLQDPSESCRSAHYSPSTSTCVLNSETINDVASLTVDSAYTYYDNLCAPIIVESAPVTRVVSERQTSTSDRVTVTTECKYGQMDITVDGGDGGFVFAKNKFNSCRSSLTGRTTLSLPLPLGGGQSQQQYGQQPQYPQQNQYPGSVQQPYPHPEPSSNSYGSPPETGPFGYYEQNGGQPNANYDAGPQQGYSHPEPDYNNQESGYGQPGPDYGPLPETGYNTDYTNQQSGYSHPEPTYGIPQPTYGGSEPAYPGPQPTQTPYSRKRRSYDNVVLPPSYQPGVLPSNSYGGSYTGDVDCGVKELSRGRYSAIIVVSNNGMGVPGLVTDEDRFYNVTCDYTAVINNKIQAVAPLAVQNSARLIASLQPDGQIYMPSPVRIAVKRGDTEVNTVTLGEQLNLDIDYLPGFRPDLIGVFVRECNASQATHGGYTRHVDPLALIRDGCPEPAVQDAIVTGAIVETSRGFRIPMRAFKFDGGSAVKVTCAIDMCEGECNPTTCSINGQPSPSFGRRRRRSVGRTVTAEARPITFTVLEHAPLPDWRANSSYSSAAMREGTMYFEEEVLYKGGSKLCVRPLTFWLMTVMVIGACTIQVTVLFALLLRRYMNVKSNMFDHYRELLTTALINHS